MTAPVQPDTEPSWLRKILQAEPVAGLNGASLGALGVILGVVYAFVPIPTPDQNLIAPAAVTAERAITTLLIRRHVFSPATAANVLGPDSIDTTQPGLTVADVAAAIEEQFQTRWPVAADPTPPPNVAAADVAAANPTAP